MNIEEVPKDRLILIKGKISKHPNMEYVCSRTNWYVAYWSYLDGAFHTNPSDWMGPFITEVEQWKEIS